MKKTRQQKIWDPLNTRNCQAGLPHLNLWSLKHYKYVFNLFVFHILRQIIVLKKTRLFVYLLPITERYTVARNSYQYHSHRWCINYVVTYTQCQFTISFGCFLLSICVPLVDIIPNWCMYMTENVVTCTHVSLRSLSSVWSITQAATVREPNSMQAQLDQAVRFLISWNRTSPIGVIFRVSFIVWAYLVFLAICKECRLISHQNNWGVIGQVLEWE